MIEPEELSKSDKITSPEQQPSLLGILILAILTTIALYSFGIHQSGKTVTGIVEALVKEVVRDYRF